MEKTEPVSEFKELLSSKKVVVLIFYDWSGQAHNSRKIFREWQKQNQNNEILIREMNPDLIEFSRDWVLNEVKDLRGNGSIVWLYNGNILGVEEDATKLGIQGIEQKTQEIFSKIDL